MFFSVVLAHVDIFMFLIAASFLTVLPITIYLWAPQLDNDDDTTHTAILPKTTGNAPNTLLPRKKTVYASMAGAAWQKCAVGDNSTAGRVSRLMNMVDRLWCAVVALRHLIVCLCLSGMFLCVVRVLLHEVSWL